MKLSRTYKTSLIIFSLLFFGDVFSQPANKNDVNENLVDVIVKSRIALQESFELSETKDFNKIYYQTLELEGNLAQYFYSKSSDTIKKSSNFNPQIVLARIVYIEARTWCMTEPLKKRTDYLFSVKMGNTPEEIKTLLKLSQITNKVGSDIDRAKRFDRLKYRYNSSVVVANWEFTVDRLKNLSEDVYALDSEYQKSYRTMLSDLYSMIGVLDMYKDY